MAVDGTFWRGKRVLLTGHTGFKGSWLSLWLQHLGAQLFGYALEPPTAPSMFERAGVADGMVSTIGDVRDLPRLQSVFEECQPEIVIHMAAQSLVRRSYVEPVETYATNVMGTVHVLEACRNNPSARVVVNVTSDKCYENQDCSGGYRESEPMGGHDPYSSSKGCAELVTAAYRRSFFSSGSGRPLALASARAGNVIGGGDWAADRLVPDMIRAFQASRPMIVRHPQAIRPWQHVLEPLAGYLGLAQHLWVSGDLFADGWNFGPNDEDVCPVSSLVQQVVGLWGGTATWQHDAATQPHETAILKLDCSRAKNRLGWSPRLRLNEALQWTVDWYRAEQDGEEMRSFTLEQIDAFDSC